MNQQPTTSTESEQSNSGLASRQPTNGEAPQQEQSFFTTPPAIQLPTGGGAIRGIDEKFQVNPATGSGSMTVSIATSPGRNGFGP